MNREDLLVKEYMMMLQTQNGGKVIVDTRPALQAQLDKIESLGSIQSETKQKLINQITVDFVEVVINLYIDNPVNRTNAWDLWKQVKGSIEKC